MKKAIIFDLDNTIFPTESIGDELFQPLFEKLQETGEYDEDIDAIKKDVMRIPFQAVAEQYGIKDDLKEECMQLLKELTYDKPMQAFEDFEKMRKLPVDKFVVTTGFMKMQQSKVRALELERDFEEIHIVDPTTTDKTKKDAFKEILDKYGYAPEDVLVIGDDPDNEIKGANELGIETVLYDKEGNKVQGDASYKISDYKDLKL